MEDKAEFVAGISIVLSVILFLALPIQDLFIPIGLFCFGFSLVLVKGIWISSSLIAKKFD